MAKCQGLTKKDKKCKSNALENGYCQSHQDQFIPEITPEIPFVPEVQTAIIPAPRPKSSQPKSSIGKGVWRKSVSEIQTTTLTPEDRVLRYRMNPRCPECSAHPTVCMIRRKNYGFFRCRICGHKFEVKR
jgi:hypothetical protein